MSSKIEVPRELLQKVDDVLYIMTGEDCYNRLIQKYGKDWWNQVNGIRNGLCTLIAAPVVERQPLCYQARHSATEPWFFTDKPCYWEWRPVYTSPPELAELQATITELETKLNNAINLDFERRETITRLESEAMYAAAGFQAAKDEIERLKGGQGEPVAWANDQQLLLCRKSPREDQPNNPMLHNLPRNIAGSALKTDYCNTPMFASQPAPVSVVLPARKHPRPDGDNTLASTYNVACGWNAYQEEMIKLGPLYTTRPSHANAPADSGTHPHNDGLDDAGLKS
jgi:hypothetical protein